MKKEQFLQEIICIKEVSLATSFENKPTSRIIDMMYLEQNRLFFLTAEGKRLYRDITLNPYISLSTFKDKKGYTLSGVVQKEDTSYLKILFDHNPFMYDLYKEGSRNILDVFSITDWTGEFFDITGNKIVRKAFAYKDQFVDNGSYFINKDNCTLCKKCFEVCPVDCIDLSIKEINQSSCVRCGACLKHCNFNSIEVRL